MSDEHMGIPKTTSEKTGGRMGADINTMCGRARYRPGYLMDEVHLLTLDSDSRPTILRSFDGTVRGIGVFTAKTYHTQVKQATDDYINRSMIGKINYHYRMKENLREAE